MFAKTLHFILTLSCSGIAIGVGVHFSKSWGKMDFQCAKKIYLIGIIFALILSTILVIIMSYCSPYILLKLGAQQDIAAVAYEYLLIALPSTIFLSVAQVSLQILRSVRRNQTALYISLAATLTVVIINPIMIYIFNMKLNGAAIGALTSSITMMGLATYLTRDNFAIFNILDIKKHFYDIAKISLPTMLGNASTPIGFAYITYVIADFGVSSLAGLAAVDRIIELAFCLFFTIPNGLTPALAQNISAGKTNRAIKAIKLTSKICFLYGSITALCLLPLTNTIGRIFHLNADGFQLLQTFTHIGVFLWIPIGLLFVSISILLVMNHATYVTLIAWARATVATIPLIWLGSKLAGASGALIGQILGAASLSIIVFLFSFKKLKRYLKSLEPNF